MGKWYNNDVIYTPCIRTMIQLSLATSKLTTRKHVREGIMLVIRCTSWSRGKALFFKWGYQFMYVNRMFLKAQIYSPFTAFSCEDNVIAHFLVQQRRFFVGKRGCKMSKFMYQQHIKPSTLIMQWRPMLAIPPNYFYQWCWVYIWYPKA